MHVVLHHTARGGIIPYLFMHAPIRRLLLVDPGLKPSDQGLLCSCQLIHSSIAAAAHLPEAPVQGAVPAAQQHTTPGQQQDHKGSRLRALMSCGFVASLTTYLSASTA
jgi:hypothetical protein